MRTLQAYRKDGWTAAVVEKWLQNRSKSPCPACGTNFSRGGIRQDLFGFIDILAIKAGCGIHAVQCTSVGGMSARVKKIREERTEAAQEWLAAGGEIFVVGWESPAPRKWRARIVGVVLDEEGGLVARRPGDFLP